MWSRDVPIGVDPQTWALMASYQNSLADRGAPSNYMAQGFGQDYNRMRAFTDATGTSYYLNMSPEQYYAAAMQGAFGTTDKRYGDLGAQGGVQGMYQAPNLSTIANWDILNQLGVTAMTGYNPGGYDYLDKWQYSPADVSRIQGTGQGYKMTGTDIFSSWLPSSVVTGSDAFYLPTFQNLSSLGDKHYTGGAGPYSNPFYNNPYYNQILDQLGATGYNFQYGDPRYRAGTPGAEEYRKSLSSYQPTGGGSQQLFPAGGLGGSFGTAQWLANTPYAQDSNGFYQAVANYDQYKSTTGQQNQSLGELGGGGQSASLSPLIGAHTAGAGYSGGGGVTNSSMPGASLYRQTLQTPWNGFNNLRDTSTTIKPAPTYGLLTPGPRRR